ncbi:MAG: hypothetical protein SFU56_06195 [Capsulimonadales bacterium]|nr:hypothetical protein [Capsulimonadales bacterium]
MSGPAVVAVVLVTFGGVFLLPVAAFAQGPDERDRLRSTLPP